MPQRLLIRAVVEDAIRAMSRKEVRYQAWERIGVWIATDAWRMPVIISVENSRLAKHAAKKDVPTMPRMEGSACDMGAFMVAKKTRQQYVRLDCK
jgi:hypothetical protein